jgi:hypothetical protein
LAAAANHNGLDGFGHSAQLLGTPPHYQNANPIVNSIFGNFEESPEIAFSLILLKNILPKNHYSPGITTHRQIATLELAPTLSALTSPRSAFFKNLSRR